MPKIVEVAAVRERLAALPVETYEAGATVLAAGSTTGKLLVLKEGAVEVVKDEVQIGQVTEPGALFGELSLLLGQPHTADVRALQTSAFYVADAEAFLMEEPAAALYIATLMAERLDRVNHALIEIRRQLEADQPKSVIGRALDKLADALGGRNDPNLAMYPYTGMWI